MGLQGLDQGGLAITRRRLGEMLVGVDAEDFRRIPHRQRRQEAVTLVLFIVVPPFLIDGQEAGKGDRRAVGAQGPMAAATEVDGDEVQARGSHLRGDAAFPDEVIETPEIPLQPALKGLRGARDVRGADGLVGLLGIFGLGLVAPRGSGQEGFAIMPANELAHAGQRLFGEIDGVGAHVGDQAGGFIAEGDALIKLLGDPHGAAGGETELARRLLLQGGGGEGGGGLALPALALHLQDLQWVAGEIIGHFRADGRGVFFVGDVEGVELPALPVGEAGRKLAVGMAQPGGDGPVFLGDEGLDLVFPLTDQTQRRTLHAAGRQARAHLAPEQRREVEAHEIVQGAARLLGVDQVHGNGPRMGDGVLHRFFGDLVKDHPLGWFLAHEAPFLEQFQQMPGNGLAFAVRIGGQPEFVGALEGLDDGLHMTLIALDGHITHGKIVFRIDGPLLGEKVAHVTVGGQDLEILPQIFLDGLGLGRGFDDDELTGHGLL